MYSVMTADGRALKIQVIHSYADAGFVPADAGELRFYVEEVAAILDRRVTLARVTELTRNGEEFVLGEGFAVCHPNDTFKKDVGTKVAIGYALQASSAQDPEVSPEPLPLTYLDRAVIWKQLIPQGKGVLMDDAAIKATADKLGIRATQPALPTIQLPPGLFKTLMLNEALQAAPRKYDASRLFAR